MPRYFFHLSFGDRLLPDEEGVELASRSAARQEALADVRELFGSVTSRWASWFLRVADGRGQFLSLPIGYPALELVSNDRPSSSAVSPETAEEAWVSAALSERATALFGEALVLRRRTAELLERNRQLRAALLSEHRANQTAQERARQLTAHARRETSELGTYRTATRRRSPPRLLLLPGGE